MTDLQRFVVSFLNVEVMARYLPSIAGGFLVTVELALAVIATGLAVGLVLAMVRSAQIRPFNWAIVFFVDLGRALPPRALIPGRSAPQGWTGGGLTPVSRLWRA